RKHAFAAHKAGTGPPGVAWPRKHGTPHPSNRRRNQRKSAAPTPATPWTPPGPNGYNRTKTRCRNVPCPGGVMSDLADTFRTGCGAAAPLRLGCGPVGQPPEQVRAFETPFVLVGRDERNDLVLAHQAVSRRHAYLQLLGGRLFCLDLKSRYGVRL